MDLVITATQKIAEVQHGFQKRFPFLKIEFFENGKPVSPKTIIDPSTVIGSLDHSDKKHELKISGLMKVSEVEKIFGESFGVNVQVFRKSGNVWLNTSSTDHWTLSEQNHEAAEFNKTIDDKPEQTDYHEQE